MRCFRWPALLALLLLSASAAAQGTKADYARAAELQNVVRNKVFRDRVEPHWFDADRQFWYKVRTGPASHEFLVVEAEKGRQRPAFDHQKLAQALARRKIAVAPGDRLPIAQLHFDAAGKYVDLQVGDRWWRCDLASYELSPQLVAAEPEQVLQPFESGPKASRETGEETRVTFINRTGGEVELFWLDPDGKRRSYGRLRPGQEFEEQTFAGHVWLVVDDKGHPLGLKVAETRDLSVAIRTPGEPGGPEPRTTAGKRSRRSASPQPQAKSSDGRYEAFIKDYNVWIRGPRGKEFALSRDGTAEDGYSGTAIFWSPDSRKLVAVRTRQCRPRKIYFVESSPRDQLQPRLHSHTYVKPGDPLPIDRPQLFDVESRRPIRLDHSLYDNPWSIEDYRWAADSSRFTFLYNQRGHQALRLLAVDAASGAVRPIIDEQQLHVHRLFRQVLSSLPRRSRRTRLDVGARRLEPPLSLRCQDRAAEEPDHQRAVGRPRGGSHRRSQAADVVRRRRHRCGSRPLLHPLLPRQSRRLRFDRADRRRRHAQGRLLARRQTF